MYKSFFLWIFLLVFTGIKAQELNCSVTVNADQISVSNNQVFKTLENSITELINQTKWTKIDFEEHERVKCAFTILLTEQTGTNSYKGTVQVQASRPVFNSVYYSPIINHQDNSFTFRYTEFQPLNFNVNVYESNLISVISYYSYLILGIYADTFSNLGGEAYLKTALSIANQAQQSGSIGWDNKINSVTRFTLIDQLLTQSNESFRKIYYSYHFESLDTFERNQKTAVKKLIADVILLKEIYDDNPNNILIRMMMDAKADEIVNVFRKNRGVDVAPLVSVLKKIAPNNSKKWKQIYSN
ncbi:hypothetical protein FHR24_001411 [Wenyingzhuangia heitensis]|uniref:DUF4835 domain-containing protein n=1 Tax=Wenyingzhuangia heitensis TaxID=1487859 RepID=A0ABX0UD26_9FLAO|nr:DUF4835 family protein [Wenyingzhuangia heitensis]NIJ44972.1 hypothetical protein [Wenyingzhuangia heitensis]